MPSRDLPARPHLDHLKNEAKALRSAFLRGDDAAVARVASTLGPRTALKLTDAQRVVAREYGFPTWARLRSHVQAARGLAEAETAFLGAVFNRDPSAASEVLRAEPRLATTSLHVAAVLGRSDDVLRLVAEDPSRVRELVGSPGGDPLLWLCYSPFHGESAERDAGLETTARALLHAGADPNTRDDRHGLPALYAVTGVNNAPAIARLLLEAGADPDDGESVFHAAERFHEEALELLLRHGVRLNVTGDWGNTPLYFLLRYWDVERHPRVRRGLLWLLDHGADPDVRCGREERETSLHVAVRRGQSLEIVKLLLEHGADVRARRGDGRTPWLLARRAGNDELASLLEAHGAEPETLSPADRLLEACGRGDGKEARRLASPELIDSLDPTDLARLPEAAGEDRTAAVAAFLEAGFPVDTADEIGATALHHAAIHGRAGIVRDLLRRGASFRIRDRQHHSTPLGWACFGADHVREADGDYEEAVRELLEAGARLSARERPPEHSGVREVLRRYASRGA